MKLNRNTITGILAAGASLLAGSDRLQAVPDAVIAAFPTGTQGQPTGGSWQGWNMSVPYGAGTIVWDGITYDAADGSTGSAYITANFSAANNVDVLVSSGPGYNNWYYENGQNVPGFLTGTADGTQYHAIQFDILWDTNSALTIDQFNTGNGWPTSYFTNPAVGPDYMATNSYYTHGVNIDFFTGSGGANTYVGTFQVPAGAATGWQTVTVPYSDSLAGIGTVAGIWFQGAFGGGSELAGTNNASFWIDNVTLLGNQTISGPPTVNPPAPATPGLNIFNATEGNSFYDRNEVLAKTTSGLSWVGNTPASYSFNMAAFPKGGAYSGEAYMFLIPNSAYQDGGADYNEPNAMVLEVQSTATGGWASLSYKVATPASETYTAVTFNSYSGGPNPPVAAGTGVPSTTIAGNYTLTFTGNDAGTVTAPDGTTGSFTLPASLAETYFAENGSNPYNFLIYLGSQANSASYMNQSVVYQSVTVTGPPNGAAIGENFLADANAATPALQNWASSWSGGSTSDQSANVLVPSAAKYWVSWTLPASGYSLVDTPSLNPPAVWHNVSANTPITLFGVEQQLVGATDLQNSTNAQYFALLNRTFSQLQVLLPGETNAPNTPTGKIGSFTAPSLSADGGEALVTVTVIAVDSAFNPVGGINDQISITDSGGGIDPNNAALVGGSAQFTVTFINTASGAVITATDAANVDIPAGNSTPFNVNP